MSLLVRLAAGAASLNLLVDYLAEFWPNATHALPRFTLITVVLGALTLINYRGTGIGAGVSAATAAAKLAAWALCVPSVHSISWYIQPCHRRRNPRAWTSGCAECCCFFFSYGGYEIALITAGESRNPRRDAPFAIFAGLLVVALIYTLLQATVMHVVPDPSHSSRPLADAARALLGRPRCHPDFGSGGGIRQRFSECEPAGHAAQHVRIG